MVPTENWSSTGRLRGRAAAPAPRHRRTGNCGTRGTGEGTPQKHFCFLFWRVIFHLCQKFLLKKKAASVALNWNSLLCVDNNKTPLQHLWYVH